jgi:hypothetical protein
MTFTKNIGFILLAVFLILFALTIFSVPIPSIVIAIVALVSGIFILIGK